MSKKPLPDIKGVELTIGDRVVAADSHYGGRPKLVFGEVLRFGDKKITIKTGEVEHDGKVYEHSTSRWPDQVYKLPVSSDSGVKLYTRSEVEAWRNDMVDSCLALIDRLKGAPMSVIIKGIEGLKTNG